MDDGGAGRDRTDDILLAKQALSQLSYGPKNVTALLSLSEPNVGRLNQKVVGLGRFELPTSRLSSARSNQLSYKPEAKPTGAGGNPRAKARQTFAEERETKAASSAEWDLKVFDAFGLNCSK